MLINQLNFVYKFFTHTQILTSEITGNNSTLEKFQQEPVVMTPSAGAASGLNVFANNSSVTKVIIPNKNVSDVEEG